MGRNPSGRQEAAGWRRRGKGNQYKACDRSPPPLERVTGFREYLYFQSRGREAIVPHHHSRWSYSWGERGIRWEKRRLSEPPGWIAFQHERLRTGSRLNAYHGRELARGMTHRFSYLPANRIEYFGRAPLAPNSFVDDPKEDCHSSEPHPLSFPPLSKVEKHPMREGLVHTTPPWKYPLGPKRADRIGTYCPGNSLSPDHTSLLAGSQPDALKDSGLRVTSGHLFGRA